MDFFVVRVHLRNHVISEATWYGICVKVNSRMGAVVMLAYEALPTILQKNIPEVLQMESGNEILRSGRLPEDAGYNSICMYVTVTFDRLVMQILQNEIFDTNDDLTKRLFSFMEKMASTTDNSVCNLLYTGVVEEIVLSDDNIQQRALLLMGPNTQKLYNEGIAFQNGHTQGN